MSFAGEVKTELCRASYTRKCCAQAECYGILLYSNTFSQQEVRIITESAPFAQRLPALLAELRREGCPEFLPLAEKVREAIRQGKYMIHYGV